MKVIKRDGRIVEYDNEKISIAIQKANREVRDSEKASLDEIKIIQLYYISILLKICCICNTKNYYVNLVYKICCVFNNNIILYFYIFYYY